jgi:polar amino acid transport system substrate-binding protein
MMAHDMSFLQFFILNKCLPLSWVIFLNVLVLASPIATPVLAQNLNSNAQVNGETLLQIPFPVKAEPIRVVTRLLPPFVMRESDELTGFSIDLWRAIARKMGRQSTFVEAGSLLELLDTIRKEQADTAIAAISITSERERSFDFSQPMFESGLQIMIPLDASGNTSSLSGLMALMQSSSLTSILWLLLVLMIIPVPVIWLLECPKGRESLVHSRSRLGTFFKSLWWSSSMVAGQATEMPSSFMGRIFAVVWMFVSLVFISYFTASVTTALTVRQLQSTISGPKDLVGKTVATVKGSTGASYLKQQNVVAREFERIEEAYEALNQKTAAAIVYDAPILLYHASNSGRGKFQIVGPVLRPESYGILFPADSILRKQVNSALLSLKEEGEYNAIYRRWFTVEAP